MDEQALQLLQEWLSFRDLSLAELVARYPAAETTIAHDAGYANLKQLTRMGDFETTPGMFFFADEQLALFYVDGMNEALEQISLPDLLAYLGEPEAELSSRAGKQHTQYVYPQQGIAFAAVEDEDEIAFLEIFPPTTLAEYEAQLYIEPAPFIR
jgi:hypothetical protein